MTFVRSAVVDAPLTEVFEWHRRPGAVIRLTPPWLPVRIVSEAETLEDGRAVLRLPGGVRWEAQHLAEEYDPPHRFVDELVSAPLNRAIRWRHTHEFRAVTAATTLVTDTVDTNIPDGRLRAMVAYRHRQLAGDLAALQMGRQVTATPLTVAVTGSTGLVGAALTAFLTTGGHRVVRLVRRPGRRPDERQWQPDDPDPDLLQGVDAVVHLAGASIAGRFTAAHKDVIRTSRIAPTAALAKLVAAGAATGAGPRCLVTASAIGFYGADRGDEILTEASSRGDGFLADLVTEWEAATHPAADAGIRTVQLRTGIVQSPRGGTLQLLRPLFGAGVGGRLGRGDQWMAWIGIDDLTDLYYQCLLDSDVSGPVNAVAPHPVRNAEYTATLARVLRRPALVPVPGFGPRLLLGSEGALQLALASQRVQPGRMLAAGHPFRHAELDLALRHLLGRTRGL